MPIYQSAKALVTSHHIQGLGYSYHVVPIMCVYLADSVETGVFQLEVKETQMCEKFWGKQSKRKTQNDGGCRLSLNAGGKPISHFLTASTFSGHKPRLWLCCQD